MADIKDTKKVVKKTVAPKVPVKKVASKPEKKEVVATLSVNVLGKDGKSAGKANLPEAIFGAKINKALMAQAIRVYLANQRMGSASTKTRSEVVGSTRKIYRQKGTGRARHGAITAPIFVGGGVAMGPRLQGYSLSMPTKMKRRALFSALSVKKQDEQVLVLADFTAGQVKTKEVVSIFKNASLSDKRGKLLKKVLFVTGVKNDDVVRSVRNIEKLQVMPATNLNTFEVLNSHTVIFLKEALPVLEATFLGVKGKE